MSIEHSRRHVALDHDRRFTGREASRHLKTAVVARFAGIALAASLGESAGTARPTLLATPARRPYHGGTPRGCADAPSMRRDPVA